jgi:hypothetical protein
MHAAAGPDSSAAAEVPESTMQQQRPGLLSVSKTIARCGYLTPSLLAGCKACERWATEAQQQAATRPRTPLLADKVTAGAS